MRIIWIGKTHNNGKLRRAAHDGFCYKMMYYNENNQLASRYITKFQYWKYKVFGYKKTPKNVICVECGFEQADNGETYCVNCGK